MVYEDLKCAIIFNIQITMASLVKQFIDSLEGQVDELPDIEIADLAEGIPFICGSSTFHE